MVTQPGIERRIDPRCQRIFLDHGECVSERQVKQFRDRLCLARARDGMGRIGLELGGFGMMRVLQ